MGAVIIDGKALAARYREEAGEKVAQLRARGHSVRLDAVLVATEDRQSSSRVYAENQAARCRELGIDYRLHELPHTAGYDEVAGRVLLLNTDDDVRAIMVHLPLPDGVDTQRIQALIDAEKDVEGVNPANIGNVVYGRTSLVPCTALAVLRMIQSTGMALQGKRIVVVGASDIVGKPVAVLLMRELATVISCNKFTKDLAELTRSADVLVVATGKAGLITALMVKPGAVVIDVGIHRVTMPDGSRRLVGDVAFDEVREVAGHVTPVPGGVGPMTVSMLLVNLINAVERRMR
ncbi:MAG: bifunctional 5,10-methylenetetrahydrofolate dehydrogenase/5,10-methenyltetrahydrofolate cyclohydrolase [Phycisphaerales bacterium]|nr:bifunctional 5,10-methylenetetrahydrofolate dehydrogenase/5,10-methenyltetrahydrofolate cyclohydrolase [Phycisphaerales bacterium]